MRIDAAGCDLLALPFREEIGFVEPYNVQVRLILAQCRWRHGPSRAPAEQKQREIQSGRDGERYAAATPRIDLRKAWALPVHETLNRYRAKGGEFVRHSRAAVDD
jgi:hypothetical protein